MSHCASRSPVCDDLIRILHEQPGIHFRALERAARLSSAGQLRHHLDRLARTGRVVEVRDGGYKRFFVASDHDRNLRPRLARFARPMSRRIGLILLECEPNRTELRRRLGCADSTLGYYLHRMEEQGDIMRVDHNDHWRFALCDREAVREVLRIQRPVAGALDAPSAHDRRLQHGPVVERPLHHGMLAQPDAQGGTLGPHDRHASPPTAKQPVSNDHGSPHDGHEHAHNGREAPNKGDEPGHVGDERGAEGRDRPHSGRERPRPADETVPLHTRA